MDVVRDLVGSLLDYPTYSFDEARLGLNLHHWLLLK
jgi:hypothetical protein